MNSWFDGKITPDEILYVILALLFFTCIYALWRLNQDNKSTISIIDLVAINGRLNERKFSRFGAWIVSTWGFVYLIANDKLSEWYFVGYMGAWVANALIGKAIKDPNGEETPTTKE
jgi:hypothetical protein